MKFTLFFLCFCFILSNFHLALAADNGLPAITGDSNLELFKKYRCRVCDDIMIDNVSLVDGELVLNEKIGVKMCEVFLEKVLHNALGGIICRTVVQTKLDEIIKKIVSSGAENRIGEQICTALHFCEKS